MFRLYPPGAGIGRGGNFRTVYRGEDFGEICMVEWEAVAFKEVEGGLVITVPAGYRRGSAPIALVFEMRKAK